MIVGVHNHNVQLPGVTAIPLNLDSVEELGSQLSTLSPDLVVNTAGLTNVDQCEREPELARTANSVVAENVAQVAHSRGIPLVHISTDHLFPGTRSLYTEADTPEPLNEYARTKLLAEEWVLKACPGALVVRTNFFCWGYKGRQSFTDWIIYNLRAGTQLSLFDDVFFTPILADSLVFAAHNLVSRSVSGIVNVVGDERISKYDFAIRVARKFGLSEELIRRAQVANATLYAPRPRDMSLDNTFAKRALSRSLGTIDEYLDNLAMQERKGRSGEIFLAVSPAR